MGDYRELYRRYYNGIENEDIGNDYSYDVESIRSKGINRSNYSYSGRNYNYKKNKGGTLKVITIQSVGAISLVCLISAFKYLPNTEINKIYSKAKAVVSYNQNFKELETVEVFNKIKDKLEDVVVYNEDNKKVSFIPPLIGNIESYKDGIIIKNNTKKDVFAALDGEVKKVELSGEKANIIIDHKNGYETYYENITKPLVKEKDKIEVGECIGSNTKVSNKNYEIKFKVSYMGKLKNAQDYIKFIEDNA